MTRDLLIARLAGGVLLIVALTAGTVSLILNVAHGLEVGLAAGVAFGLADVGKMAIPVVAGLLGWSLQLRVTAMICVVVSLWCAINYYADHDGRTLLAKQHSQRVYGDIQQEIAEHEREAARLSALAAKEGERGGCGPVCKSLILQASSVRERLQSARQTLANTIPGEPSGLATMIAIATEAKADHIARAIGAVKALLFLVLLEALVWLSVPAMRLFTVATELPAVANGEIPETVIAPAKPIASEAQEPAVGTRGYYLQRLEREYPALAKSVQRGEVSVYRACVQAGLRKRASDRSANQAIS